MKSLKLGEVRKNAVALQLANSIIAGATGVAALANPPLTLVELGTLKTTGAGAITAEVQAKEAWLTLRTEREDAMRDLRLGVKRYATYAHSIFGGDKAQLQALGLDVVEIAGVLGILPAPQNVRSRPGKLAGTIGVLWSNVRGKSIFKLECGQTGDGPWTTAYEGNRVSAICGGLVSGQEYFFRVRAMGTAGPGTWSDVSKTRAA